jgi:hypothetical protein
MNDFMASFLSISKFVVFYLQTIQNEIGALCIDRGSCQNFFNFSGRVTMQLSKSGLLFSNHFSKYGQARRDRV